MSYDYDYEVEVARVMRDHERDAARRNHSEYASEYCARCGHLAAFHRDDGCHPIATCDCDCSWRVRP